MRGDRSTLRNTGRGGGAGSEDVLLADGRDKFPFSWSFDGRFILYGTADSNQDMWVLPLSGDRKPFPFAQTSSSEWNGMFSPDGRWIAYHSLESGRQEVYVAPFPGPGQKWRISTGGAAVPRWRRDGKELYYIAQDRMLTAVEVNTASSSVAIGTVKALFRINPLQTATRFTYDVSFSGQRFLVNKAGETVAPITLVVNWMAALKK